MELLSNVMSLGTPARIAIVIGALGVLGAVLVTLTPATANGAQCGRWIAPEWSDARVSELVTRAENLGPDGYAIAARVTRTAAGCRDELAGRRNLAGILAGLAVVGPGVVAFLAGSRRQGDRRDQDDQGQDDRPTEGQAPAIPWPPTTTDPDPTYRPTQDRPDYDPFA